MSLTTARLEALRQKYADLVALREQREDAMRRGLVRFEEAEAEERRRRMAAVAAKFPGALRELDGLALELLRERLRMVEAALQTSETPRWLEAASLFHEAMIEAWRVRDGAGALGKTWSEEEREQLRRPAGGRLTTAAWRLVGKRLGLAGEEAERLVFPPPGQRA